MNLGQRITHPVYGDGTIISIEDSPKVGDNNTWDRLRQSSIIRMTNGWSRYSGNLNISIKFDRGGPQGFALGSSNGIEGMSDILSGEMI
jgi:hypothetical protein